MTIKRKPVVYRGHPGYHFSLMWNRIIQAIHTAKRFVITSHIEPEGDALGSELALYHFLKKLGKKAVILNATQPAKNFTFMGKKPGVRIYQERRDRQLIEKADAAFIVDISEWERLGTVGKKLKKTGIVKICIDHHICPKKYFDLHAIDNTASSTGELIYSLIKAMRKPINPVIAENLYISALTDTGSFRYPNTSPRTHRMVAELLRYGVKPQTIFGKIYEQYRPQRFRLLGRVLLSMNLEAGGKLAWAAVTQKMVKDAGAQMEETEGFVEMLRTMHSVEMSIIFRETKKNETKVSFRSKDKANVYAVAKSLGGGGHKRASGVTLNFPLRQAIPLVLRAARQGLKSS